MVARKIIICGILLSKLHSPVRSQTETIDIRAYGMASTGAGIQTTNYISVNPGIIPSGRKTLISCHAINNYNIKELSPYSTRILHKWGNNTSLQGGIGKMGNAHYSLNFFDAGLSKRIGQKLYAGIRINYNYWRLDELEKTPNDFWSTELGVFAAIKSGLFYGAIIRNPVRFRMNAIEQNNLQTELNQGLSFRLTEKILIACSFLQKSKNQFSFQSGTEYQAHKKLLLRFGLQTTPFSQCYGFTFLTQNLGLDMGYKTHPVLGNSAAIALTFYL